MTDTAPQPQPESQEASSTAMQGQTPHPEMDEDPGVSQASGGASAQEPDPESVGDDGYKAKYEALHQQYVRLSADFDNFRKRKNQESQTMRQAGVVRSVEELMPFLDNLDRATKSLNETSDPKMLYQSFTLVKQQLMEALSHLGVKRMETVGKTFDPTIHEAVAQIPMANQPDRTILDEQQSGYMVGNQVIRVPQVVVAIQPDGDGLDTTPTPEAQGVEASPESSDSEATSAAGPNPFAQG